ncbi:YeeE/YedE family protein [Sphingosinicella rhizophila]|uniref:YeeE/YedE family protein n=1 Tax=Sphingosinicella rhizophila TaxID=3050082 RepID=A0ABU3Q840_9SPHN|nr:YeeE/YedE family protein [Sphingosinicella sp. GR2756]MDT9599128.1 YeeE/YedE family protein [Sphingosinicella sp. GR2756]
MRNLFPGLFTGIVFGAGLALSDLVNPARVQAFLDIAGAWDPTLMFVMGAALVPSAIAYLILRRRMMRPLFGDRFAIPESRVLDRPLLVGAAMFGVGWGLVGLCPGPAVAGLVLGAWQTWLFAGAMLAGMGLHHLFTSIRAPAPAYEG